MPAPNPGLDAEGRKRYHVPMNSAPKREAATMRRLSGTLLAMLVLALAAPAAAQEQRDPNQLFNEALDLAREGKTEAAIGLWRTVLEQVEPRFRPSVHRALGLGYGKLGKLPEAAYHLGRFLYTRMASESRKTRDRLAEIEAQLGADHRRVTLACDPGDAVVYLDEQGEGSAYPCPVTWWFPAGRHKVRVARVGYASRVAEIDLTKPAPQQLWTLALEPVKAAPREVDRGDFARRVYKAARAGHATLLAELSTRHGELFKGLECEHAWSPAMTSICRTSCRTDLVRTLLEAGVQFCSQRDHLEKVIELGCGEVAALMLPRMEDEHVVNAVWSFTSSSLYDATPERAAEFMQAVTLLEARLEAVCARSPADSQACKARRRLEEEVEEFFQGLSTRIPEPDLVAILAANPARARRYNCIMTVAVLSSVQAGERCEGQTRRASLFYQRGHLDCFFEPTLKNTLWHRCKPALELVVDDLTPEDLAAASLTFNENDFYFPSLLSEELRKRAVEALAIGPLLARANEERCDAGAAANCRAARHVKAQLERIEAENRRMDEPEVILEELCNTQRDLDWNRAQLDRVKAEGELSGYPNKNELVRLAQVIMPLQKSLDRLAEIYTKKAKKSYDPALCGSP
jgi:hypothetical protein